MSDSSPEDREPETGTEDTPRNHRRRSIRNWSLGLRLGLLGALVLVMIGGVWAGVTVGSDTPHTKPAASERDFGGPEPDADRYKQRPLPSPSDTTSKDEPKQENKPKPKETKPTQPKKPAIPAGCGDYSGNQLIACQKLDDFGFGTGQMSCLVPMWNRESGWNPSAANPSGAYGIPQALPGSKMSTSGGDWESNPATQIDWGLGYIADRYGDPCSAWSFWQANNYY
ncbi:MAG TPA: transglycosylase SLT domain-containing protein [Stackebrandtia sp.]|uniref:aggregation-promoting factor C-terminal-like domain-containing protein n=1 Tax=Stackebrandtia sp. TaxID=2023065 RepID=UPI002D2761A2|nr:transglycosylase SLT domain-containing protein [Stackebrandtia sp.]HZE39274.1 transglycosylase SLT domain-containing protein [Stackebrandtia sp.]